MRTVCGRGEKGGMRLGRRTAALIVAAALCVILSFVLTACNEEPVIAPSEQTPSVMTLYSWHEDAESGEVYAYFTTSSVENSLAEAPCGVRSYYGDDGAFWLLSGYSVTFDAWEACAVALAAAVLPRVSADVAAAAHVRVHSATGLTLGAGRSAACYLAVSVALKTAVQAVLLPRMGIVAAPIAQLTMYALATVLALVRYTELVGKNPQLAKSVSKIALGGVIMGVCVRVVSLVVNGGAARLALSALIGGAAYFATLALTGAFGKEALSSIFGRAAKGE